MNAPYAIGDKVKVHKNLQAAERGLPGDWTVTVKGKTYNAISICLAGVKFHVWDLGQKRARIGKRTVHLWACGKVCAVPQGLNATALHYAPKEQTPGMVTRQSGEPVEACEFLHFTAHNGAIAMGEID